METPTLAYQSTSSGEPSPRQIALANALGFWGVMLLLLGVLLATALTDFFLIERHSSWVLVVAGPFKNMYEKRYTYSFAWNHLQYVAPPVFSPMALGTVYLLLSRRLARHAGDRAGLLIAMMLTMLHTMAAAISVLLFIYLGGLLSTVLSYSWRFVLSIAIVIIVVGMVPGIGWLCIRLMDQLRARVIVRRRITAENSAA